MIVYTPKNILQYLNIGRIVRVRDGAVDWGYGYMINFHKKDRSKKKSVEDQENSVFYVADIMVHVKK